MTAAARQLLNPEVLAGLANLELVARSVVDGLLVGLHRSPQFGFSQEFAEYRDYTEGDDPRYIDWNVLARSGRTVIKQFLGETNAHLMILLDTSGSMGFASGAVTKLAYARMLAASLAYLAHRQHDAAGLLTFDEAVGEYRAPTSRHGSLPALLATLENVTPAAGTDFAPPLAKFRQLVRRRGLVAVISDFYCDPSEIVKAVQPISLSGSDCLFFQVLDPAELKPGFRGPRLIEDLESGQAMEVSEDYVSSQYPQAFGAHLEALETAVRGVGGHYCLCPTNRPLGEVLRAYLLARQGRK